MVIKYSVYERKTDRPIYIHGTAQQCAEALGITDKSFYKLVQRYFAGVRTKYEVFKEEED